MEAREIVEKIESRFSLVASSKEPRFAFVTVEPSKVFEVLQFCRDDAGLRFDYLDCMTGLDTGQDLQLIYHLLSTSLVHRIHVKTNIERHIARIPSVCEIWRAALNYELEAAEMLGIEFTGHPGPRRLLLADEWQGFPLRKDYVYPEHYQTVEHRRAPLRKEHT